VEEGEKEEGNRGIAGIMYPERESLSEQERGMTQDMQKSGYT